MTITNNNRMVKEKSSQQCYYLLKKLIYFPILPHTRTQTRKNIFWWVFELWKERLPNVKYNFHSQITHTPTGIILFSDHESQSFTLDPCYSEFSAVIWPYCTCYQKEYITKKSYITKKDMRPLRTA